ncbi:hypothetical protein RBH94_01165 [Aestuariibaculum sp. YM273]|uniref:hypothetical protein n=1 Tax=Aestuariibaculum sp. YM273 TaxID=3070659 RepID=UPI0027DBCB22|nr:hypothetical protein [Aestuariibaculum sp. YM273]WMI65785.1 hypothetical protein RBH94_01165 [Aestuariibaculum sp. YM273]
MNIILSFIYAYLLSLNISQTQKEGDLKHIQSIVIEISFCKMGYSSVLLKKILPGVESENDQKKS